MLRPLIRANRIQARVRQLGRRLARLLAGAPPDAPPLVVALLDGSFCFVADLVRAIPLPDLRIHFVRASSYGASTVSKGVVALHGVTDCRGRTVVVVDDILDTGRTLGAVCHALRDNGAERLITCVLLDKPGRRVTGDGILPQADLVGFTIPDQFVVGYGLDLDGRYRHLPDIKVMG